MPWLEPARAARLLALAVSAAFASAAHGQAASSNASTGVSSAGPAAPRMAPSPSTKPAWTELTAAQKQALAPLSPHWEALSETHKRKWLALSQNFAKLPPTEQVKLHSRMTEWVALSPQQRAQARLNFGEARQISADEKKAKWEAYQALPAEEKRKLAEGAAAAPKTPATAAAVKPVPAQKLATLPKATGEAKPPRITAGSQPEAAAAQPATRSPSGEQAN